MQATDLLYSFLWFVVALALLYFGLNYKFVILSFKVPTLPPWTLINYVRKWKSPQGNLIIPCSSNKTKTPSLDMTEVSIEAFQAFGDIVFSWFGIYKTLIIRDPDCASAVLTSSSCKEKSFAYKGIIKYMDDGILTCPYDKWLKIRKILTIAVQQKEQLSYVSIINQNAKELNENLSKMVGTGEVSLDILIKRTIMKNSAETFTAKYTLNTNTIPVHEFDRFVRISGKS